MAVRYVEIGQYPDVRREVRGNLSEILVAAANPGTYAAPEDVTGCFLEMGTDGKWDGPSVGTMSKATADALHASGALANLAAGATYRDTSGTQYTYGGAGAGWVEIISGITSRRVAAFGTSVGFGQYMVSTNDSANAPAMWMPATAYTVGQFIYPRYANLVGGFRKTTLRCSASGTTGIIEPDWDFAENAVTVDGTATFEAVTTNVTGCNFARGAWTFAQAIAGQPLDETFLVGYEGGKYPAIMSYWERALSASDPGVIFISDLWLNDISVTPFATIRSYWADLADKIAAQTAIGVKVILQTVLPKADIDASSNWTGYVYGDETRAWKWLNDKMRELAETNSSVHLLVVDDIYTDPNPANPVWPENSTTFTSQAGTGQALKFTDGTHPYQNAQWRIARRLATILASIAPQIDRFAAPGIYAGVSVNPANYGTAGGTSTNTSGTVADGYAASGSPNCTVVASKEAVQLTTRSKQVLALTASGTNATAYVLETAQKSTSELSATNIVQAFAEVEIVASPVNFRTVQLYLGDNVNSGSLAGSTWTASVNSTDQNMDEVASNLVLTLKTPPQTLGARTTLRTNVQTVMSGTGAGTVKIGRRRSA